MLCANQISIERQGNLLLDKVSCEIAPNQLVALVGHNGSGKSTLIKSLAGEMTITEGSINLDNRNIV